MSKIGEPIYTSAQLFELLDGIPDEREIQRLVEYYPSYEKEHRKGLLRDLLDGKEHTEMVSNKMKAKGVEFPTAQQKGGHGRWVAYKVRRTAIRLLYLRYALDQHKPRLKARRNLYEKFPDLTQDAIRNATRQRHPAPPIYPK